MALGKSDQPTFQQLADEALEGDSDAAYMLAIRAPGKGFLSWLARWVPADSMSVEVFDVFRDAYSRMELEKLNQQVKDIPSKVDKEAA